MMRLSAVALWTRGRLQGADADVTGFAIDTRKLKQGDLFVALPGEHVDGHDYVAAAAKAGAVAALVTRPVAVDLPQVIVNDTQHGTRETPSPPKLPSPQSSHSPSQPTVSCSCLPPKTPWSTRKSIK